MLQIDRLSTGSPELDAMLGGGLLPGTLTVVMGATGIGKTQLGLQFAAAGAEQEGRRGVVFDMNARGDSQNHAAYAERMFNWRMTAVDAERGVDFARFFRPGETVGEYLHIFRQDGRRMNARDAGFDAWHDWQAQLSAKLDVTIGFFYDAFTRGVRRAVVDGVDPADRQSQSIQFELFEYVYHQILRKEHDWVARDLFRQNYRSQEGAVALHPYDHRQVACVLLYTSHETMLDALIERPLDDGDLLAGANTIVYLGKLREGHRIERGLYVAKHRGSRSVDDIVTFRITDAGLRIGDGGRR